jgi:hypothetical protein
MLRRTPLLEKQNNDRSVGCAVFSLTFLLVVGADPMKFKQEAKPQLNYLYEEAMKNER